MKQSIEAEAKGIKMLSKGKAKKFAKLPTVKKAMKSMKLTVKDFSNDTAKYADELAQTIYDVTNGIVEVEDNRSEGRKARDWYARKNGMNRQDANMFLPTAKEIEVYAKENECTVFQAVARLSAI